MTTFRLNGILIALLFFMLWFPMGQYDFLIEHWMKVGTYAIPFLFIGMLSFKKDKLSIQDTTLVASVLLLAYVVHQYEEHWIDLLGNRYAFYDAINQLILVVLGATDSLVKPLTREAIFMINTSLVWLLGFVAIWRSQTHLFPTLAMTGIVFVNAITHIVAGIFLQAYDPGLFTSIVIFLPISIYFYKYILNSKPQLKKEVIASIIWSVIAHVIMVGGMLLANWFHLISEYVYFAALIFWSCVPAFLFNHNETNSQ